jgi:hypothetical protein
VRAYLAELLYPQEVRNTAETVKEIDTECPASDHRDFWRKHLSWGQR